MRLRFQMKIYWRNIIVTFVWYIGLTMLAVYLLRETK